MNNISLPLSFQRVDLEIVRLSLDGYCARDHSAAINSYFKITIPDRISDIFGRKVPVLLRNFSADRETIGKLSGNSIKSAFIYST